MTNRVKQFRLILWFALLLPVALVIKGQEYTIDTDFPGGNAIVYSEDVQSTLYYHPSKDTVFLRPDLRDTPRHWFYWNFRISGAEGRKLHFRFPGNFIASFGPAFSLDGGKTWNWLYDSLSSVANRFDFSFSQEMKEVRFSNVIPYTQANWTEFISGFAKHKMLEKSVLTKSIKGRDIEKIINSYHIPL